MLSKFMIGFSLFVATSAYAELGNDRPPHQVFETQDIASWLDPDHKDPSFPEKLEGIWWLKNTPSAFEAVSLSNCQWNSSKRTLLVDFDTPNTYALINTKQSDFALSQFIALDMYYRVDFNQDLDKATLNFGFKTNLLGLKIDVIIPQFIFGLTMDWKEDGIWTRKTKILSIPIEDYELTRVVDVNGLEDPAFEDFKTDAKTKTLFILTEEES